MKSPQIPKGKKVEQAFYDDSIRRRGDEEDHDGLIVINLKMNSCPDPVHLTAGEWKEKYNYHLK